MTKEIIEIALKSAFQLGQTYWQRADSDSYKQNAKSDDTMAAFKTLVTNTITNTVQPVQPTAHPIELWEQLVSIGQDVDTQPADTTIDLILEGIDLWSGDTSMGWWETSDDVAFGASKLAEIKAFFASQALPVQPAPGIDYAALYEFATANNVNYNELCALVKNARNALALPVEPPVAGDPDGAKVARLMGLLDTLPDTTNLANRAVFKAALYQEFDSAALPVEPAPESKA